MKAIVTGGNGFIGSHLVDRLIDLGWRVDVIDNLSAECNDEFYYNERATNHEIDICDYDAILPIFEGADVVFHMAAESRIQPAIINPTRAAEVNVVGTCNVLQASRMQNVGRVIYSSTSAGYGLANTPPLHEGMPRDCLNPYSVTKCAGEDLCTMYTRLFGLDTIVFRYFNVYGERSPTKGQYAPVIGLFFVQKAAQEHLSLVGDGLQRRDFTHVDDVVAANLAAATTTNRDAIGETFNVGTGINHSILEIAQMISDNIKHIPPRPAEARTTLANIAKITGALAWAPQVQLETWIEEALSGL